MLCSSALVACSVAAPWWHAQVQNYAAYSVALLVMTKLTMKSSLVMTVAWNQKCMRLSIVIIIEWLGSAQDDGTSSAARQPLATQLHFRQQLLQSAEVLSRLPSHLQPWLR